MSVGSDFHRSDAATGKEHRAGTAAQAAAVTTRIEERSRWRPGRSETRTSWFR